MKVLIRLLVGGGLTGGQLYFARGGCLFFSGEKRDPSVFSPKFHEYHNSCDHYEGYNNGRGVSPRENLQGWKGKHC